MALIEDAEIERLKLTFKAIEDGIWDWNVKDNSVFFSASWMKMLGYEPNELPQVYETWYNLLYPEDREHIVSVIQRHLSGKSGSFEVPIRLKTRCGRWKWVLSRGRVVQRDNQGEPVRVVGTHADIDEKVSLQKQVDDMVGLSKLQAEIASDVLYAESLDNLMNTVLKRFKEVSRANLVQAYFPDPAAEIIHVFSLGPEFVAREEPLEQWGVYSDDEKLSDFIGEYLGAELQVGSYFCIPAKLNNDIAGFICIIDTDMEEELLNSYMGRMASSVALGVMRIYAREALVRSEERFRILVENAIDAFYLHDDKGAILDVSKQASVVLGYTREELLSMSVFEIDRNLKPEVQYERWGRLKPNEPVTSRSMHVTKEGKEYPVEIRLTKFHQNQKTGFVALARDITEQSNHESQLRQAKEEAEESSRAKSRFVATMSHEIRTPLNAVIGITEELTHRIEDKNNVELLEVANASARHLLSLINDLLDFSKLESGGFELESEDFCFSDFLSKTVAVFHHQLKMKNLKIKTQISKELPGKVTGDSGRLRQVLINLIGNAIKFTHEGGIQISARKMEKEDIQQLNGVWAPKQQVDHAVITVEDTGIGILPCKLEYIFQSFHQADSSTSRSYGGTGLGLAICRQIIQMMNGCIWATSTVGIGSCFTFIVPLPEAHSKTNTISESLNSLDLLRSLKVLLVEDNPVNVQVAGFLLKRLKQDVTVASNGVEALQVLDSRTFDIVFTDIEMPEMDGFELVENIRKKWKEHELPVVAMTAHVLPEFQKQAFEAGMNGFITKPLHHKKLEDVLLRCCRGDYGKPS